MFTLALAFISAKYHRTFEFLYVTMFILDVLTILTIHSVVKGV